jgi:hypothetical protein
VSVCTWVFVCGECSGVCTGPNEPCVPTGVVCARAAVNGCCVCSCCSEWVLFKPPSPPVPPPPPQHHIPPPTHQTPTHPHTVHPRLFRRSDVRAPWIAPQRGNVKLVIPLFTLTHGSIVDLDPGRPGPTVHSARSRATQSTEPRPDVGAQRGAGCVLRPRHATVRAHPRESSRLPTCGLLLFAGCAVCCVAGCRAAWRAVRDRAAARESPDNNDTRAKGGSSCVYNVYFVCLCVCVGVHVLCASGYFSLVPDVLSGEPR